MKHVHLRKPAPAPYSVRHERASSHAVCPHSQSRSIASGLLTPGLLLLLILATVLPGTAIGQAGYRQGQASAAEVLGLPQFCWWEFNPTFKDLPNQIQNCGPGMNHYCMALVEFNRSQATSDRAKKSRSLGYALREVEYTLGWMQRSNAMESCSIRDHVVKSYQRVRQAFPAAGMAMPPDKFNLAPRGERASREGARSAAPAEKEKAVPEGPAEPKLPSTDAPAAQPSTTGDLSPASIKATREDVVPERKPPPVSEGGQPNRNPYCRFCPEEDRSQDHAVSTPPAGPTAAP